MVRPDAAVELARAAEGLDVLTRPARGYGDWLEPVKRLHAVGRIVDERFRRIVVQHDREGLGARAVVNLLRRALDRVQ
eukprot:6457246-Prymnesium_polylepis.2